MPPVVPRYHHSVQIYDEPRAVADAAAAFIADGLGAGQPAIVIATAERRGEILTALYDRLIPCDREIQAGRLTLFDASATLQLFMDGSGPDPARFETTFGAVIEYTQRRHGAAPIRVFGEMVDVLCRRGMPDAALQVEALGNRLAVQYDVCIFCGYARARFDADASFMREVCALHSHVVLADGPVPVAKTS